MAVASSTLKSSRKARLMAFDLWAEMSEDYSDEREALGPDDSEIKQIITHVRRGGGMNRSAAYSAVPRWFADPEAWTPYVDEFAVQRAADFYFSAWRALSLDEYDQVVDVLASRPEPFGPSGGVERAVLTDPLLRFRDWPERDRWKIKSAVHARRQVRAA